MTEDEFIDKLRYAFQCGWEASLETKLLAVARVALERAAAKVEADYAEVPFAGQSTEYHSGFFDGVEFAVRSTRALIPPEKKPI